MITEVPGPTDLTMRWMALRRRTRRAFEIDTLALQFRRRQPQKIRQEREIGGEGRVESEQLVLDLLARRCRFQRRRDAKESAHQVQHREQRGGLAENMSPRLENIDLSLAAPLTKFIAQAALADAGERHDANYAACPAFGVQQSLLENPQLFLPPAHLHKAGIPEPVAADPGFQADQTKYFDRGRNALERAQPRRGGVAIGTHQRAACPR